MTVSVRLQVSVNGGGQQTGAVTVTAGQTIQPSGVNTAGWFAAIYEIYYYPAGFNPGGAWALGADGYTWTWSGVSPPPSFSTGALWGKFLLRVRVNGNPLSKNPDGSPNAFFVPALTDESTALEFVGPGGLHDLGYGESTQFTAQGWAGPHEANLRILAAALGGGSPATSPVAVSHTNSPIAATADTTYVVSLTGGNVVFNFPVLNQGHGITIIVADEAPTGGSITVTTVGGVQKFSQPSPSNGTPTTAYVLASAASNAGASFTWWNGGASDGRYYVRY